MIVAAALAACANGEESRRSARPLVGPQSRPVEPNRGRSAPGAEVTVEVMADVADRRLASPADRSSGARSACRDVTSFQAERLHRSIRTSRLAWSFAGAAMLADIGLSVAVATMLPLVRIAPVFLWTQATAPSTARPRSPICARRKASRR